MTPEKQRIAIAEACGEISPRRTSSGSFIASTNRDKHGKEWGTHGIPDYLNDLNAMHEAEKTLDDLQGCIFSYKLFRVLNSSDGVSEFMKIHATAAQRAEAFLRTIGKWEDEQ